MSLIEWQDSYCIGMPLIDAEHRIVVKLLNQLHQAREEGQARDVVGSVLNVLVEYVAMYFERMERLTAVAGSAEYRGMTSFYRDTLAALEDFQQDYMEGRHGAADGLAGFLRKWLVEHLFGLADHYRQWIAELPVSAQEMAAVFGRVQVAGKDGIAVADGLA